MIECKKPGYNARANPTIFNRNNGSLILVVPTNKELDMFVLGDKLTKFKSFDKGEIFIKYDQSEDKIYYLQDLPNSKKKK